MCCATIRCASAQQIVAIWLPLLGRKLTAWAPSSCLIDAAQAGVHRLVPVEWYGTSHSALENVTASGRVCLLDVDVQGADAVRPDGAKMLQCHCMCMRVVFPRLQVSSAFSGQALVWKWQSVDQGFRLAFIISLGLQYSCQFSAVSCD